MQKSKKASRIVLYILQIGLALLFIVPLIWMLVASFKPEATLFKEMTSLKDFSFSNFTLENYSAMFQKAPLGRFILNSFSYILVIVVVGIFVNALAGYALARLPFRGSAVILGLIIALYIIPFESVLMPLYTIVNKLHLVNKMPALFLPFIANCFNIFLFRQFFSNIPAELEEAAYIDGATPFQVFYRIVLPMSKPVIATSAVLTITTHWGDFMWPLLATTDESIRTVQIGIQYFFTDPPVRYGSVMAALVFTTLPMVIVFLFLQKYYVQGISSSGIKG